MGADRNVFLFAGIYPSEGEARLDHEVLKELHVEGDAAGVHRLDGRGGQRLMTLP